MALKDHMQAAEHYINVLRTSPFRYLKEKTNQVATKLKFNSISCYAHAWSNLAVIFLLVSTLTRGTPDEIQATQGAQLCIKEALTAMPEGEGNEAYINMNNVMRQLGCRQEAFTFTWMQLK